jgi:SAM-dependent methyltransferase
MNRNHQELCASDGWGEWLRDDLIPWVIGDRRLGGSVLEIGPGPGLSTDVLRSQTRRLTAIESDPRAAMALGHRLMGTNVTVVRGDATEMPFAGARFTAGVAMTMLHHVPSVAAQDLLLAEACRVLRPGGWLLGVDSLDDPGFREFHKGDICVPVDPGSLGSRLSAVGFTQPEVEEREGAVRFSARRP